MFIETVGQGQVYVQPGPTAVHFRRHVTDEELASLRGGVRDIRGTDEARTRLEAVRKYVPAALQDVMEKEGPK